MPDVETRLARLAADLGVEVPDGLESAVMVGVRGARPQRRWRRWVAGLFVGLLGVGVVASPVGASIREWLGFHGVAVSTGDPVTETPTVPPAAGTTPLDEAAGLVGFTPLVPEALGPPERVAVSRDRLVVSLSWTTGHGTVRLDEFRGDVEPLFWKTTPEAEHVAVGMHEALWLPTAHEVTVVSPEGDVRELPSRLAAPTLLWVVDDLTLRLEGDLDLVGAAEIASSVP
jgi:hypothetical protein